MFARAGRYQAAYTHLEPSRDPELLELILWIRDQSGSGLLLVGPQKDSLENSEVARELVRRRAADYTTLRTRGWSGHDRVIALWPTKQGLQELDDVSSIEALGVLTWGLEEVLPWASAVGAVDLLGLGTVDPPLLDDPLVLGALRTLTNGVNLSSGLTHPSDWDRAVEMFRELRRRGRHLDGQAIETWALANGWSYRYAEQVGKLAGEIGAGKAKRTKSKGASWKPTKAVVDHWAEVGAQADWQAF